jgi:hypothetical protein
MATRTFSHRLGGIALVCALVLLLAALFVIAKPADVSGATSSAAAAATPTPTGLRPRSRALR